MNNKDWYLIQRLQHVVNSESDGINKFLRGDYMGSAEFEFGAVGKSWGSLRVMAANGQLDVCQVMLGGTKIYVIKNKETTANAIQDCMLQVAKGKLRTKESTYWDYHFNKAEMPKYIAAIDSWVSVDYYMFSDQIKFFTTNKSVMRKMLYELLTGDFTRAALVSEQYERFVKPGAGPVSGSFDSVLRPYLSNIGVPNAS